MALSYSADSNSAKLQVSFQNLTKAANSLNAATDVFGECVRILDEALRNLSPGVAAWVTFSSATQDNGVVFEERLGYAKVSGKWGLCLATKSVDPADGEEETEAEWLFSDAPRNLRLRAIQHVPELIEALAQEANRTAKQVNEGAEFAKQMTSLIVAVASGEEKRR